MSYKRLVFACGVALGLALFLVPTAALGLPGDVMMEVNQSEVTSPGVVSGAAGSADPGLVTVRATIDGVEIDGSPDSTMEGEVNDFAFAIPEGNSGKFLVITAIDAACNTTRCCFTIL